MNERIETQERYRVVVNHEEQYSIWFLDRAIPDGWRDAGKHGTKDECLAYIDEVWTDMRPLSLRQRMSAAAQAAGDPPKVQGER
jgi:MbtH protein